MRCDGLEWSEGIVRKGCWIMNVKRRVIAVGLAATLSLGVAAPMAFATPQDDLADAAAQLETYGAQLATYEETLQKRTAELEDTSYRIGEKQTQIKQTEQELAEAKAILGGRMRSSYKSGSSTLLGVVLGADSLNDIVSRIYYMDKIAQNDAEAIQEVRALEERLTAEQADLEATKQKQQAAVDELKVQVSDYEGKVDEAREYYTSLDAEIQRQIAEQQAAEENARIQAALEAAQRQEAEEKAAREAAEKAAAEQAKAQEQQQEEEKKEQEQQQEEEQAEESDTDDDSSGGSSSGGGYSGGGIGSAYAAIGSPYVWGAAGPNSFDCSGLVCWCYGYGRGRSTYDMISSLQASGDWKTSLDQLNPGDLVFTSPGHVGIYLGGGQMIHAPHEGATVCEYYVYDFYGGGPY